MRGKAHANTEFGSKLHISLVNGYARIERLDFEPFNGVMAHLQETAVCVIGVALLLSNLSRSLRVSLALLCLLFLLYCLPRLRSRPYLVSYARFTTPEQPW